MKQFFQKAYKILGGRVARNIYFWGFLVYSRIDFSYTWEQAAITCILFGLLVLLSYSNNLYLVPRFLAKKKYLIYWTSYAAWVFVLSMGFLYTLKLMLHYFPAYSVGSVSPITSDATANLSIISAISELTTYYAVMFIWGCVFTMCWYAMDYAKQISIIEETKKKQTENELNFLKGQMNPHFLFNTLNNLYALSIKKSENTPNVILKLSSILRYMLYESNGEKVSFEKEREVMQAYIDLELLRINQTDGMLFSIHADGPYNVPPLLWLPVLENLFKHGTRFIADKYYIEYKFSIEKNVMTIYSKNNYKPVPENDTNVKDGGMGLENLKKRLSLLYPGKHKIYTQQDKSYYITEVEIELS